MAKRVNRKNRQDISAEWDRICFERQSIIEQGKDLSLTTVTCPCILRNLKPLNPKNVLDIGCGTGYLTYQLAGITSKCTGIDFSDRSIQIAKTHYRRDNLTFECCAIEDFTPSEHFDACVANMVFTSTANWLEILEHIHNLMSEDGHFLLTVTHPWFWPRYWGYQNEPWFDYKKELHIEHDFKTSLSTSIGTTTHIHRSLSQYINGIISAGYAIEKIEEPYPTVSTPSEYHYDYPRFLFIQCKRH